MDAYRRVQVLNGFLCFCSCFIGAVTQLTVIAVMKRILLREVPEKITRMVGRLFHRFIPTPSVTSSPFGLVRAICLLLMLFVCLAVCAPTFAGCPGGFCPGNAVNVNVGRSFSRGAVNVNVGRGFGPSFQQQTFGPRGRLRSQTIVR